MLSPRAAIAAVLTCAVTIAFTFASPRTSDQTRMLYRPAQTPVGEVIINEVDCDTPGSDLAEFVELFDGGVGNTPLDGYVVVFFNGGAVNDASYAAFDLDGFTTDVSGYFTLGNAAVPGVDLVFSNGLLQNGPDAVAIFAANGSDFPNGTPITTTNIRDALVYANSTTTDAGLLVLLNAGQLQVNENATGTTTTVSMQRVPNGSGGARNTDTYQVNVPTPDGPILLPTSASLLLSGRVTNSLGTGIARVQITIEGGGLETPRSALTTSFGYYKVRGLSVGTYVVTVSAKRYTFAVPTRTLNMVDNVAGFDFVAEP
jgi:hypothetical protein